MLQVLYADDIAAYADMATDCMLMVKNEISSKLKLAAAAIDTLGNFVNKLDEATEKIYKMRTNEQK